MYIPDSLQLFIRWIQVFDIRVLQTEGDVEKKFILPMFQYLGYPDSYRQSKYSLTSNNSENPAKQLKNSQIYFATDDVVQQNSDTSLIIIIYLAPNTQYFSEAITQAKFYSTYLKPIFFIITNGYSLKIFKYFPYHREELIFDGIIDTLRNSQVAENLYYQLNFDLVRKIPKTTVNNFKSPEFSSIEKYLRRHQEFSHILEKAEFEPCLLKKGNHLTVVKPKVLMECNLPQAFGKGDCVIQFSSVMLRGLKISLNHQQILGQLMTGLYTKPEWGCRRFLKQLDTDTFEAYLGQTTVIVSELEAADLCLCVDAVCQAYQNKIIEFENYLETWDFKFVEFPDVRGFHLFSVDVKLWKIMHNFIKKFNYAQGKSEWHVFDQDSTSIRVSRGIRDHAFIVPRFSNAYSALSNNQVDILYEINDSHIATLESSNLNSWQEDIGIRGTWTAKYTKTWLIEKYIPQVMSYHSQKFQILEFDLEKNILNYPSQHTAFKEINDVKDFLPYLRDIQVWLRAYIVNIATGCLQQYYQVFTDLVRNTDTAIAGLDYITMNLQKIIWKHPSAEISRQEIWNFKDVIYCLDNQVAKINNCKYIPSWEADLITRIFIWIIENGKINHSQGQLNVAKQALLPLWEQCRFEMRHIYPYRTSINSGGKSV
ncbi:type I restriction enzyme HsdR N-terminal domain-containing protein [Nostoc sp. FACHB-87]|uniref:type I restriction enzyme HsdR N-terminal domain-containing protein n=1 Tax=Nostocaceae TaxID=1162 RepID=UPI001686B355|nr:MULTISPECIES: type I restriction enzyme HsdR N-terminal domain-containing protein [Nostocaceae]MBD2453352.1 type I restriction enzyme HsdR N-terminal domain-containing protein [Nostoc sp. FACHB-87]MBD2475476.1 type I restriction enzyme HsdR N-terminal domain-containing protein [Anabaena sp. FACHB-83]